MRIKSLLAVLVILCFLLLACSSAEKDYEKAQQENTTQAYEKFIQKHPNSNFAENVVSTLDSLRFEIVKSKHSIEAYNEFVEKYPESNFLNEAKRNIDVLISGGETILKDQTLFTDDFYKRVKTMLVIIHDSESIFSSEFSLKVPSGEEPNITKLHEKYGIPDRMEEHKLVVDVIAGKSLELIIHWYGDFGFGVPKDISDKTISNKVMWIFHESKN
jgi:outer membrane protein assembly factor BamD (BamD/ComL family)